MSKKVLVTGFQPFLDFKTNPSQLIAEELDGSTLDDLTFVGRVLPVTYDEIEDVLLEAIESTQPDLIIGTGLAAGRTKLSLEKIAANYKYSTVPDNNGNRGSGERIDENMPDGIFSRLDIEDLVKVLNGKNIPTQISMTAGAYICNYAMFVIIRESQRLGTRGGFVHLPADTTLSSSMPTKAYPSMEIETMAKGIRTIASQQLKVQ